MTVSVVIILSLISGIAAAPTQDPKVIPPGRVNRLNHPVLGDIRPGNIDDKIINRIRKYLWMLLPLCMSIYI